ncbi:hypothetical protein D3C75_1078230 [compost metagenome]
MVEQVAPQLLLGIARLATENALPQWHVFCVLEDVDAAAAQACTCLGFQGVVVEQPTALRQVRGDIAGKRGTQHTRQVWQGTNAVGRKVQIAQLVLGLAHQDGQAVGPLLQFATLKLQVDKTGHEAQVGCQLQWVA